MLVILRENVDNLGKIGELVRVTEGYARNFLLPRKMVSVADENNVKQIENHKRQLVKKRELMLVAAEGLAKSLADARVNIARKVGDKDKLFGSVTAHDVQVALENAGFNVKKTAIHLEQPIKALGVHTVTVKLDTDVSASVKVWVVKEE